MARRRKEDPPCQTCLHGGRSPCECWHSAQLHTRSEFPVRALPAASCFLEGPCAQPAVSAAVFMNMPFWRIRGAISPQVHVITVVAPLVGNAGYQRREEDLPATGAAMSL